MASCQLYKEIITEFQRYGYKNDRDFPQMIIINYPFSGMLNAQEYTTNQQTLIKELQYCFDWFNKQNIDIVIIACNTLHALIEKINIKIPIFISIPQTVLNYATNIKAKKLLILGTEITNQMKLYSSQFVECITPNQNDQIIINTIINNILAGDINRKDVKKINKLVNQYKRSMHIDSIVLACTELPLLYEHYINTIFPSFKRQMIFDSVTIMAQEIVKQTINA